MKQCINCSNDFEPKHETRGHEQLYCSIKCRTEAYKKRSYGKGSENELHNIQRSDYSINPNGNISPYVNIDILEGKYQAKTEALEYKLRYEQVVKELEQYKIKVTELENEIEEYENDNENSNENYLGSIMDFAKSSPELGNALGKLMQNEKVQNFILSIIPDNIQNQ